MDAKKACPRVDPPKVVNLRQRKGPPTGPGPGADTAVAADLARLARVREALEKRPA